MINVQTKKGTYRQSLVSGQGYFSNNAKELCFGLGKINTIDLIEIKWPSGLKQVFKNINPNQTKFLKQNLFLISDFV